MIFFAHDYETTGVKPQSCGVVQSALCLVEVQEDGSYEIFDKTVDLLNPGEPIPEGASGVHGIYDKDVEHCPDYREFLAEEFSTVNQIQVAGAIGYNSKSFDDVIAQRCGLNPLPSVDLYVACRRLKGSVPGFTSAKLGSSYKALTGREPENAHDAFADIVMTLDLIKPVMALTKCATFSELCEWLNTPQASKSMLMPFGKYKDQKICNIPTGYKNWALNNLTLPEDVKASIELSLGKGVVA